MNTTILITKNTISSYNTAVAQINKHQKENVGKLNRALSVANENNSKLYTAVNFTNEDTLDENLKLYRILDRYEYSEPIS